MIFGSVASAGLAILTATRIAAAALTALSLSARRLDRLNVAGRSRLSVRVISLDVGRNGDAHRSRDCLGIAVPILTSMEPAADGVSPRAHTTAIWRTQVRFIGACAIAVAAGLHTLPNSRNGCRGLVTTLAGSRSQARGRCATAISRQMILLLTAACLGIAGFLASRLRARRARVKRGTLTIIAGPFVLIGGFLIAGICGYMAGLIGASNSPISGVGILSIVVCAAVLIVAVAPSPETSPALVAFALFVTAIVFACATISNDNLQDLKTGQLVGASPMRQQIALIVGVIAGAAVIPFVLNLLAKAYGFAGAANVGVVAPDPLPADQGDSISALAQGVIAWQLGGG